MISLLARTLTLMALLLAFPAAAAAKIDWSDADKAAVDALVARFMKPRGAGVAAPPPAMSIAVSQNGRVVLSCGYGEAAPGRAATGATIYNIGSVTKQFTAAAVLSMIERGSVVGARAFGLDDPLSLILDGVEHWSGDDRPPVTVRNLLTMTSSLPNFTVMPPGESDPWGAIAAPELLAHVKKYRPIGWPNSFEYSNTSYFLLAQLLDAARSSDMAAATGYRGRLRRIFADIGLNDTGFREDPSPAERRAIPTYRRRPAFLQADWLKGSGDMISTVDDLQAWNRALMEGRVLSPVSRDLMFSNAVAVSPQHYYGMGWFVEYRDGRELLSHSGAVPGFTSYNAILRSPNNSDWTSVSILTNSDGVEDLDVLADDILRVATH